MKYWTNYFSGRNKYHFLGLLIFVALWFPRASGSFGQEKPVDLPELIVTDILYNEPYVYTKYKNVGAAGTGEFTLRYSANEKSVSFSAKYKIPEPGQEQISNGAKLDMLDLKPGANTSLTVKIAWLKASNPNNMDDIVFTKEIIVPESASDEARQAQSKMSPIAPSPTSSAVKPAIAPSPSAPKSPVAPPASAPISPVAPAPSAPISPVAPVPSAPISPVAPSPSAPKSPVAATPPPGKKIADVDFNPGGKSAVNAVFSGGDSKRQWAQTFTIGATGVLAEIDLFVKHFVPTRGSLIMELRRADAEGIPTTNSDGVLCSVSVDANSVPQVDDGFVAFDLASRSIRVVSGEKYAVALHAGDNASTFKWLGLTGDPYSGGKAFDRQTADEAWVGDEGCDLGIRTFVVALTVAEAIKPSPATAVGPAASKKDNDTIATETKKTESKTGIDESPKKLAVDLGGGVKMELTLIPVGEFMMGSSEKAKQTAAFFNKTFDTSNYTIEHFRDDTPQHRVRITKPFYLGTYHVTLGQFRQFVADTGYKTDMEKGVKPTPSSWNPDKRAFSINENYSWRKLGFEQTDEHPVVFVSWNDAVEFCKWLSKKEGNIYRLPTEAEWEYACRAGTTARYYSGDDPETLAEVANVADAAAKTVIPNVGMYKKFHINANDGFVFTSPVGKFKPNDFGLYDMHGNAWQWCTDWHGEDYYSKSPIDDPKGPDSGESRVLRGGSFNPWPYFDNRSAARYRMAPGRTNDMTGFRVARTQ
jgi:formylglycine-generating enzyme